MRKSYFLALALVVPVAGYAYFTSTAVTFDLKDPKSVNSIQFTLDGRLEQFTGFTRGVTGDISFDPADIEATRGKVIVDAASLQTNHPGMEDHIHGSFWLDVKKFPLIEFDIKKVDKVRKLDTEDASWSMLVTGDFSMHGVTKSITIPVHLTHLPGELGKRNRGAKGDLVVLRSEFTLKRSDFGVDGGQPVGIVSDEIDIRFSMGAFQKPVTIGSE